jgi:hypothetical protein
MAEHMACAKRGSRPLIVELPSPGPADVGSPVDPAGGTAGEGADPALGPGPAAGPPVWVCPAVARVPSLRDIGFLGEPSPSLPAHVCELLYGYAYTLRVHNGDWRGDVEGASGLLVVLGMEGTCPPLGAGVPILPATV